MAAILGAEELGQGAEGARRTLGELGLDVAGTAWDDLIRDYFAALASK